MKIPTAFLGVGSTEKVGFNRNHDGYTNVMLARDHPTFEKHARWYVDHKNSDPRKSGGIIKRAWYSPELERVEVIAALNATKEAAARNGGLIAHQTLTKLAANREVDVSQSVRVPYDTCVICHNNAPSRAQYCTGVDQGGTCKYGGCRDNLGRVYDDGVYQGVDNPRGTFFDCSDVSNSRGADRTAFITGKVANAERVPGGAELAEHLGLVAPDHLLEPATLSAIVALRKLAAHAYPAAIPAAPTWETILSVRSALAGSANKEAAELRVPVDGPGRHQLLADLAAQAVVLPPAVWLSTLTGTPSEKCAAAFQGTIDPRRDLLDRADVHEMLGTSAFEFNNQLLGATKYAWLAPSTAAHAQESARGVLAGRQKHAHYAPAPAQVAAEAKARYLAYQANVLARNTDPRREPLLLNECVRHWANPC